MVNQDAALKQLQGKWATIENGELKTIEIIDEFIIEDGNKTQLLWGRDDVWVDPAGATAWELSIHNNQLHRFARANGPFPATTLIYTRIV